MLKLFIAAIIFINCGEAYIFPISPKHDRSYVSYLPSVPFLNSARYEEKAMVVEVPRGDKKLSFYGTILGMFDEIFCSVASSYKENIHPAFIYAYKVIVQYLPTCLSFSVHEEKAKADSKLYFLFIAASFGIYFVLYIYFSWKLYHYYRNNVRQQYLDHIKKVFEKKDKD